MAEKATVADIMDAGCYAVGAASHMNLHEQVTCTRPLFYREIQLTQGQVTLVDVEDYDWLSQWKWNAWHSPKNDSWYAVRTEPNPGPGSRRRNIWMHREILGLKPGDSRTGDHIETVLTLDNRRHNLRVATPQQQCCNQRLRKDNTSGFKGVSLNKRSGRYAAYTAKNGSLVWHGSFATPEEAAAKRAQEAARAYGEFYREK